MTKYISYIIIVLTLSSLTSCKQTEKPNTTDQPKINRTDNHTLGSHPGKKIMETKCYVCHNPSTDREHRIAPPMVAIKSHYIDDNTSKEEFSNAIWNFIKEPSKEKIKLKGAVKRFGVMPYQPFSEEDIKRIAEYMYTYKIDEPVWFKAHLKKESKGKVLYRNDGITEHKTITESKIPEEIGLQYALNTKKELGKNLMGTIQKKGTLEAISFCNKQAYPITDSMAIAQNAMIKRVSDKPRNPLNQANSKELAVIETFKKAVEHTPEYKPITEVINDEVKFYYPIITNSMCLQCHGKPNKDINKKVIISLSKLYPKDKAIGYDINEVRGIWSITYKQ